MIGGYPAIGYPSLETGLVTAYDGTPWARVEAIEGGVEPTVVAREIGTSKRWRGVWRGERMETTFIEETP